MALLGADLLVLPTNWPTHSECAAEHMMACRAMENTIYTMAVNRVGEESGFRFIGGSSIVDPSGRKVAEAGPDQPEILYADMDPARGRARSSWYECPASIRSIGSRTAGPASRWRSCCRTGARLSGSIAF